MIPLCHVICIFYLLYVDGLPTLHECHCSHQLAHGSTIFVPDWLVRLQARSGTNCVNIPEGVVLCVRCPSGYYRRDSVLSIATDITSQDQERCSKSVFHRDELLELLFGRVGTFTQPSIPYPDVQGVVVANSAGYNLCHGNVYIAAAPPAPARAATTTRTTSRITFHQFIFFMFNDRC